MYTNLIENFLTFPPLGYVLGIGTIISSMLPYSVMLAVTWISLLVIGKL